MSLKTEAMIFTGKRFFYAGVFFAAAIVFSCGEAAPQLAVVTVNAERKFQTMTGWEATAQAGETHSPAFELYREMLFEQAVNDLGINRLRLELRSGAENPKDYFSAFAAKKIGEKEWRAHYYEAINDNDDPFSIDPNGFQFSELDAVMEKIVVPMKMLLEKRGERLFLNLNYIDFKDWRGRANISHKDDPEEYAELILAVYRHLQGKYGFVPDAVEVLLEPDTGTGWTGTDLGRVIAATGKRLRDDNFKPAFIAPSTTNAANAPIYIDEIARIPGAMNFITEFSYHRYCCASEDVLKRIADRAARYDKKTAMLEWIGADYETLHEDLKTGNNSAWQQYTLAFPNQPDNGAQYFLVNDADAKKPVVGIGKRTRFLRQYFLYVRAGARRIGAETSNPNFDALAFTDADGRYAIVIKCAASGKIAVRDLPPGRYAASYATAKETNARAALATIKSGETFAAEIPANGVLTVFSAD